MEWPKTVNELTGIKNPTISAAITGYGFPLSVDIYMILKEVPRFLSQECLHTVPLHIEKYPNCIL